jgi:hypothetical protein
MGDPPGPICASRLGPDWIDDGTLCQSQSSSPGPAGLPTPQQRIDSYLDPGWYYEWTQMERQVDGEQRRYDSIQRLLKLSFISPLYDRIWSDFNLLIKIAKDYRQGMNFVIDGRKVSKVKIGQVHDIYTMALGVVEGENDVLEALWATGFAAAWVIFPFVLLQAQSQAMLDAIAELTKELKRAEREATKTVIKTSVHAAVVLFELFVPELALAARAAIYLGEVAIDKALGPEHPTAKQKIVGDVTPGVKQFSEAVHHIPEYGKRAQAIAKKTGRAAIAVTFYFDAEELAEGYERVNQLKELLEKVQDAYTKLVRVIEDNKPMLEKFLAAFDRWTQTIESIRKTAGNVRGALSDEMAKAGYGQTQVMVWSLTR